jgi:DNA-binding NarL/FixJ family response regulator
MSRVALLYQRGLLCEAVTSLLASIPGLTVAGVAQDEPSARKLLSLERPDLVVAQPKIMRPDDPAFDPARRHAPRRVYLLPTDSKDTLLMCILANVEACLPDDCGVDELVAAVEAADRGEKFVGQGLMPAIIGEFRRLLLSSHWQESPEQETLSERERDVLTELVLGHSNKQIAHSLGILEATVKTHLHSVYEKLHVQDRTQAAVKAVRWGWVDTPDVPGAGNVMAFHSRPERV